MSGVSAVAGGLDVVLGTSSPNMVSPKSSYVIFPSKQLREHRPCISTIQHLEAAVYPVLVVFDIAI